MPKKKVIDRQDKLREIIQEKRKELWRALRDELFGQESEDYRSQFERAMDSGDRSVADLLASLGLKRIDIRQDELSKLFEAERKLDAGTYGVCEECGEEIGAERLAARPFAIYCVRCKERLEEEKIRGKGPTM